MATAAIAAPSNPRQPRYSSSIRVRAIEFTPAVVAANLSRLSPRQINRLVELLPERTVELLCSRGSR